MTEPIYFSAIHKELPQVSIADFADIKPPYVHFRRKYHEYILYYILSGELYLTEGDTEYTLGENDFILLNPSREHVGRKTSTCRFLYVHFSFPFQETKKEDASILLVPKYYHIESAQTILACHTLSEKLVATYHNRNLYYEEQTGCYLYELLLIIAREHITGIHVEKAKIHGAARHIIPDLITFLNESYFMDLSGEEIEQRYNYNFDYLNRQFKKWTGQTIFNYLNAVRIESAKQLLSTGYYTISDIALKTGFRDVYYFSRVFKKCTGLTPGKYQ